MTFVAEIATRTKAQVPALVSVDQVAELAALVQSGALPQQFPASYVIPLGFDARAGEVASGMFTQMLEEVVGVVLIAQAIGDPKGLRALATIDTLITAVIAALVGWSPTGAIGAVRAVRGRLMSMDNGVVFYQLDFAIPQQLRITR
ncbi:MAG: hypothetical protein AB7U62_10005 [Pseudolabrys sp.]